MIKLNLDGFKHKNQKNQSNLKSQSNSNIIINPSPKNDKSLSSENKLSHKFKDSKVLGDYILHMRFCAKFHLQMCAVLSQFGNHVEAIDHANKAAILSEDNILRTNDLYTMMDKNKENNSKQNVNHEKVLINNSNEENSDSYIEKMIQEEKINECEIIINNISQFILKNRSTEILIKKQTINNESFGNIEPKNFLNSQNIMKTISNKEE